MKKYIFIFAFLIFPILIMGQISGRNGNRIEINFHASIDCCVDIIITDTCMIFYKPVLNQARYSEPLYRTINQDSISLMVDCINDFWNTTPIIDTTQMIIDDWASGMAIFIYKDNAVAQRTYVNRFSTFFPYSYTEFLCTIREIIAVHKIAMKQSGR